MASVDYETIEAGIETALKANGTLFKTVVAYGSHLSDAELAVEIEQLKAVTPAALIVFTESDANKGKGGVLDEEVSWAVVVVAASTSREALMRGDAQRNGIYQLIKHVRETLHNSTDLADAMGGQLLYYAGSRRFGLPGHPLTVAAYQVLMSARVSRLDGPAA